MTPEIPGYVLLLESVLRPFVMTIALGLIWLGAACMPASAKSRYTTAGVLSAVLLGWEAVAQYLGAANTYLASVENPPAVPTILFGLLIPLAVAAIATTLVSRAAPPVTHVAIQDVSVVDVAASTVHPHMTVLIEEEKIKAVVASAAARIPPGARIVNGTGKFLIPGLWDMHVHLWYHENQLPVFLAFGVTGVQDVGSDFERTSAWRTAIETGKAIGPHIVTAGPPVNGAPSERWPMIACSDSATMIERSGSS